MEITLPPIHREIRSEPLTLARMHSIVIIFQLRICGELKAMQQANRATEATWVLLAVLFSNTTPVLGQSPTYKQNSVQQEDTKMNEQKAPQPIDKIPPEAFLVFREEMAKREIDLSKYNLHFYQTEDVYIAATSYKQKPVGLRGSVAGFPDYEVKILRKDNSIQSTAIAR